jgi:ElaB/YqjD/DUF883 family membrane-anchored ribosome-binding protein
MKKKSFIIFLLILSNLCNFNLSYAAAYELPPDLLSKLHSNINVAELYASNNWGGSPIDYAGRYWYYNRIEIDPNSIYGSLSAYNVLIMAETSSGFLMTEQINTILNWVKSGGGLIISDTHLSDSTNILLNNLGITAKNRNYVYSVYINKDNMALLDCPVTVGVERILVGDSIQKTTTAVDIDNGFIFLKTPIIGLTKTVGNGRVLYLSGQVSGESGLRFGVNCIEWVAGYTPPDWSPSVDSQLVTMQKNYNLIVANYSKLQSDYNSLKLIYNQLQTNYDTLINESQNYTSLRTDYNRLKTYEQSLNSQLSQTISQLNQIANQLSQTQSTLNNMQQDYQQLKQLKEQTDASLTSANQNLVTANQNLYLYVGCAAFIFLVIGFLMGIKIRKTK